MHTVYSEEYVKDDEVQKNLKLNIVQFQVFLFEEWKSLDEQEN